MRPRQPHRQPALPAAQRADPRRARRGHRHRRSTGDRSGCDTDRRTRSLPEAACTSVQFHLQTSPGPVRGVLERRPGHRRRSSSRSAPTRRTCSGGSCGARPGSRCSSRPPTPAPRSSRRRACGRGSGSASGGSPRSSTCSRRTCATSRRCCPSSTTRTRWRRAGRGGTPELVRAAPAQRHRLPLEPSGLRRRRRRARTCGWRTGCCPPARRSPTPWPTPRSTSAWSAALAERRAAGVDADVVQRRRGELPRRAPGTASTPRCTGPASGEVRATELVLRRLLPLAARGPGRAGASRPASRDRLLGHHRAAVPARQQRRRVVRAPDGRPPTPRTGTTRCARRCRTTARHAQQRAGAHLVLSHRRVSRVRAAGARSGRHRCAGRAIRAG